MIIHRKQEAGKSVLFTPLFGLLTSGVGIFAILGWILGVPVLTSFSSSLIPMAPSTAFLFISFGTAVLLRAQFSKSSRFYRVGIIIYSIGTLIALILFCLSSFGIYLTIEHLGFKIEGSITGAPFGHISPLTAFCFVLAGLSFLISLASSKQQKKMLVALSFAFLVSLASSILLLAHLFGTPLLYGTQFIPPALSTSLALFFLGIALIAMISSKVWQNKNETDAASTRSTIILFFVFVVLATGIISAGYFYYKHNEKEFRLEKGRELSSIAELKISELTRIRKEWVEDASLFYKNTVFSTLVDNYFYNAKDINAHTELRIWLSHFKIVNQYNNLCLYDAKGIERFALPVSQEPHSYTYKDKISEALKSGKITIDDFYKNEFDQHIYLNIFVPISDPKNNSRVNGVLSLRIDPEEYLYPYIKSWPTPSRTSETMLVRRDGDDVLFLNEVKLIKQNAAFSFRISLKNKDVPAVKAVLGGKGIVEGFDYRNVPVLAYIHQIPASPWFIVTKIDIAEVYEPLTERLWLMILLIIALLFGGGTSIAVVWRHQRARFYQERFQSAETLRESHELLEKVFNNTHIMMAYLDPEFNFIRVNQAYAEADEHTPDFYPGKNHFTLFPYVENEILFRKVVETGQSLTFFAKPFEYVEHPERKISYWDWSLQPVKASDGSVTALVLSLINVTERMQAQGRIQKLNRVYAFLSNINQAIVRIHDIKLLFNEICRIAIEDGKFKMVWIGMLNPQTNNVDVAASAGLVEGYLDKIRIDLNDETQFVGPTLKALRYGHSTISNDIANDENMIPWRDSALKLGFRSSASFPIKVLGTVRGVVKLYSDEVEFFTEDEIKLLDEMAMDVSFALEFIEHEAKRKQAEEFLLKFRMGIERSGDAVLLTDPDGTIVYVNPAFENTFGYSKEEAIGKTPRILKSDTLTAEYYKNFWNDILAKKAVIHEIVNKTKDGKLLSIEASVNPIINKHGEIIGYLAIERDITERKLVEQEIISQKNRFAQLFENSPIAIALLDNQDKIVLINESFSMLFGYFLEEIKGQPINNLIVPPELQEEAKIYSDQTRQGNQINKESYRKKKDGTLKFVQIIGVPVSVNDLTVGIYGMYVDLTQRKQVEKELITAKEKAEEMSRLKSNFLANMSHELRTPLNGIMGYADILSSLIDDPGQNEMAQGIYLSGKRLSETLNFILDLSEAETDRIEVIAKDIAVIPIVKNSIDSFSKEAAERNLQLETIIKEENISVHLDEHLFSRILHNLLDNAIKFTKEGKVIVEIGREITSGEDWLSIKIKDTGIGIAEDKIDLIWDEFRQVSEGLTRSYEGAGLGLTISKKAVELMQGNISVESELGVGSTFTVKFPAVSVIPQKEEVVKEKQAAVIQPEKETAGLPLVLCVEDDFANRNIIKFFLKNTCVVDLAEDATAALQLAVEKKYDLVLMDINLGGEMNGMEVVQEILKMPQYFSTPIIAVTAYAMGKDKTEFLRGGCTHYISKPFQKRELIDLVTSVFKNN